MTNSFTMMDERQKEELVARFRQYLDQEGDGCGAENEPAVDLFSLFTELAGLKSEVRLESRRFKTALDEFRGVFSALDSANQAVMTRLAELRQQEDERAQQYLDPVISGLMEMYDSLSEALAREDRGGPGAVASLFCRGLARRYRSHVAGLRMLLERTSGLLALCDVEPIDVTDKKFDPRIMKAVDFRRHSRLAPGMVCGQQRTGFVRGARVIRPAEVIVAKGEDREDG